MPNEDSKSRRIPLEEALAIKGDTSIPKTTRINFREGTCAVGEAMHDEVCVASMDDKEIGAGLSRLFLRLWADADKAGAASVAIAGEFVALPTADGGAVLGVNYCLKMPLR